MERINSYNKVTILITEDKIIEITGNGARLSKMEITHESQWRQEQE
jgi:hypothetical protein